MSRKRKGQFWPKVRLRNERFVYTMISKKIFAWYVITGFFYFQRVPADAYLYFTAAIFVIDVAQKKLGMEGNYDVPVGSRQVSRTSNSTVATTSTTTSNIIPKPDDVVEAKDNAGDA